MAALQADRNTPMKAPERLIVLKAAASTTIYAGGLVSVNATGYAIPAADAASTRVMGRAERFIDNSAGADGDLDCVVRVAVFKLENSAGAALTLADVGKDVMVEDDQTVALTSANSIVAGQLEEIDEDGGVWVAVGLR